MTYKWWLIYISSLLFMVVIQILGDRDVEKWEEYAFSFFATIFSIGFTDLLTDIQKNLSIFIKK